MANATTMTSEVLDFTTCRSEGEARTGYGIPAHDGVGSGGGGEFFRRRRRRHRRRRPPGGGPPK